MKQCMKSKDKFSLGIIRMALAEIKQIEIDEKVELSDDKILTIIAKMIKQRRDAAVQFGIGKRPDLQEIELREADFLQINFMPEQISDIQLEQMVIKTIELLRASGPKDIGLVMSNLKSKSNGQFSLKKASDVVKAKLNQS